jgi:hypothetical protein
MGVPESGQQLADPIQGQARLGNVAALDVDESRQIVQRLRVMRREE